MNTQRLFAGTLMTAVLAFSSAHAQVLGGNIGGAVTGTLNGGLRGAGGLGGLGGLGGIDAVGGLDGSLSTATRGTLDRVERTRPAAEKTKGKTKPVAEPKAAPVSGAVSGAVSSAANAAGETILPAANAATNVATSASGSVENAGKGAEQKASDKGRTDAAGLLDTQSAVNGTLASSLQGGVTDKDASLATKQDASGSAAISTPKLSASTQTSHSAAADVSTAK